MVMRFTSLSRFATAPSVNGGCEKVALVLIAKNIPSLRLRREVPKAEAINEKIKHCTH